MTPFLLHRRIAPRIVVGSVNTAEVAVAFVAAGSLLSSCRAGVDAATVIVMLAGGIVAASGGRMGRAVRPRRVRSG